MAQFIVNPATLHAAAEELNDQNNQLKSLIDQLVQTEATLSSMWEGDAKLAFHNAFIHDKGAMDNFNVVVNTYVATLNSIAAKYEQVEAQNTEIANKRSY